jgi:hypothetical protein
MVFILLYEFCLIFKRQLKSGSQQGAIYPQLSLINVLADALKEND